jgi:uncharacterized protein (TIGR02145 family)
MAHFTFTHKLALTALMLGISLLLPCLRSSAQTLPNYLPTDGLVAWWPFNGNANDESGNGHHGFVDGAILSADRFGVGNRSFNFSGDGNYIATNLTGPQGDRSITVWFKQLESNQGENQWRIFSYGGITQGSGFGAFVFPHNIASQADRLGIDIGNSYVTYEPILSLSQWHHLAIVYSTTNGNVVEDVNVFLNGAHLNELAGSFNAFLPLQTGIGNPFTVGHNPNFLPDHFQGNIDDIGIWNRALTDAEVMALYLGEAPVVGCTDPTACNFNPEANAEDGSCVPSGCLDAAACNFNAAAGCGGVECDFTCCPGPGCCGVGTVWDAGAGVCVPWVACPDLAYNPDYDADGAITVTDLLALLAIFEDVDSDGDGIFDSMDDCFGVYDGCGVCGGAGVDADADGVCDDVDPCVGATDVVGVCGGTCTADVDGDGVCDAADPCVGTLDACGVCNGPGPVYACGCGEVPPASCNCAGDPVDALGVCGGPCAADADADGVCDDVDACVGALDACGVCNGPGPNVQVIDQIIFVTDSAYIPQIDFWYVFTFAVDTLYTFVCPDLGCIDPAATNFDPAADVDDGSCLYGPAACGGLSTVTFDGHTYALVGIGSQCWFKENLRSDTYRNGDPIPGGLSDAEWTTTTAGAQAVYNEDPTNLAAYGRLYNWYAVNDARGLCPTGWHVPSDGEWTELETVLGGASVAGAALKASSSDVPPWDGSNTSGFSALPGGSRNCCNGGFSSLGNFGYWWSSSPSEFYAWNRFLFSGSSHANRGSDNVRDGFSVRCLRYEGVVCLDLDNDGVCAENEVSGCTDSNATNFNPAATEDDASCVMPGPAQCGGVSTVTFDGHTYTLVGIGSQCWFKENLRSDNYRNGDAIPGGLSEVEWRTTWSGAQAVYNEDAANLEAFGRLYNFHAVEDPRGLCPVGFHVPTDEEWTALELAIGMNSALVGNVGWRGDHGAQLKSTMTDTPSWDGDNFVGFSGLAGGYRNGYHGVFDNLNQYSFWWTASVSIAGFPWDRNLGTGMNSVNRDPDYQRHGNSVRCVRDDENACIDLDLDGVCLVEEVDGCTDSNAANFNPAATEENGTCVYPSAACGNQTSILFDGYDYPLVAVGEQCWFKENLRSDNYRNGDPIPGNLGETEWRFTSSGAQAIYGEGEVGVENGSLDEEQNLSSFGRLYNWYAVDDSRGLCPSGFHVPTSGDWQGLESELGLPDSLLNELGWRGEHGVSMKSNYTDVSPWDGTNSTGFAATPAGVRNGYHGTFGSAGSANSIWSATPDFEDFAFVWSLGAGWHVGVNQSSTYRRNGCSVRCLKD